MIIISFLFAMISFTSFSYNIDSMPTRRFLLNLFAFILGLTGAASFGSTFKTNDLSFSFGFWTVSWIITGMAYWFSGWFPKGTLLRTIWLTSVVMSAMAVGSGMWGVEKGVEYPLYPDEEFRVLTSMFSTCSCKVIESDCGGDIGGSLFFGTSPCQQFNTGRVFIVSGAILATWAAIYISSHQSNREEVNIETAKKAGYLSLIAGILGFIAAALIGDLYPVGELWSSYVLFCLGFGIFLIFGIILLVTTLDAQCDFEEMFVPPHLRKGFQGYNLEDSKGRRNTAADDDYIPGNKDGKDRDKDKDKNKKKEDDRKKPKSNLKPQARIEEGAGVGKNGKASDPASVSKRLSDMENAGGSKKDLKAAIRPANHPFNMDTEKLAAYLGKKISDTVREIGLDGPTIMGVEDADVRKSLGGRVAKAVRDAKDDPRKRDGIARYDAEAVAIWLGKLVSNAVKETELDGPQLALAEDHDIAKALGSRVAKEVRALHLENDPLADSW